MIYIVCRFISFLLCKTFFRFEVFGKENIPRKGGFIIASNHVSFLDPILIGTSFSRKLNYMAKKELFNNPLFAAFLSTLNVFAVKRGSADLSAVKEALRRLEKGKGLLLFPSGTREASNLSGQPQAGVAFLAAHTQAPVIPAFIKGSDSALPKGAKFIRPRKIYVYFGQQIPIERRLPYQDIANRIMQEIRQLSCSGIN